MSDLSEIKGMAVGAMNAMREHKPASDAPSLLQQYRKQHEKDGCRVISYVPDQEGILTLLADARCPICLAHDAMQRP